jgi:hypothetical protein
MAKHVLVAVLLVAAVFCHAAASDEEGKDVIKLINDKAKPTEDFETQVRKVHHESVSVWFHTVICDELVNTLRYIAAAMARYHPSVRGPSTQRLIRTIAKHSRACISAASPFGP